MAEWQLQSRRFQVMIHGVVFTVVALIVFYFLYCQLAQPTSNFHAANDAISIPISLQSSNSSQISQPSQPPVFDPTKLAFLVETRPLPHLPFLFSHMTSVVPAEWTFRFMGSTESIAHMRSSPTIRYLESTSKLRMDSLPSQYSVSSRESISQMFTDLDLYTSILAPAEHLLVFQPDSIFCANSPSTVNDFLEWDWIGAPWSSTAQHGGNGGLSLRRVSKIVSLLGAKTRAHDDSSLEDLWLTDRLAEMEGAHLPDAAISKTFSVESVWDDQPLGYHVGWMGVHHGQIWDNDEQVDHILRYCPEVKMILGMKLDRDKPKGVD